jgi:hypothetical protein
MKLETSKVLYVIATKLNQSKSYTHKDVETAAEPISDVANQALALIPYGHIADGAGDAESLGLPLLEALSQLRLLPRARVHHRPQCSQLLHHCPHTYETRERAHERVLIYTNRGRRESSRRHRRGVVPDAAGPAGDQGRLAVE